MCVDRGACARLVMKKGRQIGLGVYRELVFEKRSQEWADVSETELANWKRKTADQMRLIPSQTTDSTCPNRVPITLP